MSDRLPPREPAARTAPDSGLPASPAARSRVGLAGGPDPLTARLARALNRDPELQLVWTRSSLHDRDHPPRLTEIDCLVYLAAARSRDRQMPDLEDAEVIFSDCRSARIAAVVLVSSAAIYEPGPHHPGLVAEETLPACRTSNPIPRSWRRLEKLANDRLGALPGTALRVLRPAALPVPGGRDYFSRLLDGRMAVTLPGHDPSLQILALDDFAQAVCQAIKARPSGVFNVAPAGVVPLRQALKLRGVTRLPIPRCLQRPARAVLSRLGLAFPLHQLDYARYSWTVSDRRIRDQLGLAPTRTSEAAIAELGRTSRQRARGRGRPTDYDAFGMDLQLISRLNRGLLRWLSDFYWRIEVEGLEHLPREGPAVLVGLHRSCAGLDGVMTLHLLTRDRGRCPRFLIHPGLIKFPFLFDFFTKLGGVIACRENADLLLDRGELLGVFPEGVRGAFTRYREAYKLEGFRRHDFVRMALRHSAPILPYAMVGPAETFPILGGIRWRWWRRYAGWPFVPITHSIVPLPLPLPAKWHIRFLPPLPVATSHGPEAAGDPTTVRAISREVHSLIAEQVRWMLARRKSIFFGSVFDPPSRGSA